MHIYPGIILPICWHNDDTDSKVKTGNEPKVSEYDVRPATFYSIEAVLIYRDPEDRDEEQQGKEYSQLHSGGTSFLVNMRYKELKAKIDAHMAKISKPTTDAGNQETAETPKE